MAAGISQSATSQSHGERGTQLKIQKLVSGSIRVTCAVVVLSRKHVLKVREISMFLSAFMVETLAVLVEPPPAISGTGNNLTLGKAQPQANIGVFMFLFMFCAIEVVFIKLISYATMSRSAAVGTQTLSEEDTLNNNTVLADSVFVGEGQRRGV